MPLDLGLGDRALLDLASQPRTTRQRSGTSSNRNSVKVSAALTSTEDIVEMRLDDDEYALESNEEEEEDDDDSASIYQDSHCTRSPLLLSSDARANGEGSSSHPLTSSGIRSAQSNNHTNITSGTPSGDATLPSPMLDATQTATTSTNQAPTKRGRKPAPAASRGAREQARKTNHSRIEKRRREKINDALSTLRELVPSDIATMVASVSGESGCSLALVSPGLSPALSAVGATNASGKKKGEKEFKLEVLERTVIFVKYLLDRVRELERHVYSGDVSLEARVLP